MRLRAVAGSPLSVEDLRPLLDRIDLQVEVAALTSEEVSSLEPGEPSCAIRERVETARANQRDRFHGARVTCNAEMTTRHLRKPCEFSPPSRALLTQAIDRLGLSARARTHDRILKVSRAIADLAGTEKIEWAHVAETVQYWALDRAYFRTG